MQAAPAVALVTSSEGLGFSPGQVATVWGSALSPHASVAERGDMENTKAWAVADGAELFYLQSTGVLLQPVPETRGRQVQVRGGGWQPWPGKA